MPKNARDAAAQFEIESARNQVKAMWNAEIDALCKRGMTAAQAASEISAKNPKLHEAFLKAANPHNQELVARCF